MKLSNVVFIHIKDSVIYLQSTIESGNTGDLDWPLGEVDLDICMDMMYHHIRDIFGNGEDALISTGKTTYLLDYLQAQYPLNVDGELAVEVYEISKEIFMHIIGYELEDIVVNKCSLPSFNSYTVDTKIVDGLIKVYNNGDIRINQWYMEHVFDGKYVDSVAAVDAEVYQ